MYVTSNLNDEVIDNEIIHKSQKNNNIKSIQDNKLYTIPNL